MSCKGYYPVSCDSYDCDLCNNNDNMESLIHDLDLTVSAPSKDFVRVVRPLSCDFLRGPVHADIPCPPGYYPELPVILRCLRNAVRAGLVQECEIEEFFEDYTKRFMEAK